jgi:DNA helicase IV
MQLRMLARRAQHNSMTVLGDLAQATGPASPVSWSATLAHLGEPANAQSAELTIGYRLPGSFLALANRLLSLAAPGVAASRSARTDGDPADVHELAADDLVDGVAEHALALAKEFATVAVIAADARVAAVRRAIEDRGVLPAEPGEVSPDRAVVVLPAGLAKGLEFDAVIVVEPAEIFDVEPNGVRLLFVALTRAVQHLALAHSRPLPAPLLGADAGKEGAA